MQDTPRFDACQFSLKCGSGRLQQRPLRVAFRPTRDDLEAVSLKGSGVGEFIHQRDPQPDSAHSRGNDAQELKKNHGIGE